jgi:hypothetical protein
VPLAVVAGAADEVVPAAQSRAVAAAAGASYVELPRARQTTTRWSADRPWWTPW